MLLYAIYVVFIFSILFFPYFFASIFLRVLDRKAWYKTTKLFVRVLIKLMLIKLDVKGLENIPDRPCIFAPNQLSHLDGFILRSIVNNNFFAITEPFRKFNPVFSFVMKKLKFIQLRRTEEEDKKYKEAFSRYEAVMIAEKQIENGLSMLIFPEGHFERKKKLRHFYPGAIKIALHNGVPIVPVSIQGTNFIWPPDRFIKKPHKVKVEFGNPISFNVINNPSERLINEKTVLIKKKVANMLPKSFLEKRWQNNE